MNEFAIFIMVWGRPDKMWTLQNLRKSGYTGKIFFVADNLDPTVEEYKKKYGDDVLVFDKEEAAKKYDAGDNSHDLRSTLYSANTIRDLAREKGYKYYMIMCDDYTGFYYNFNEKTEFVKKSVKNLDEVFKAMLEFYKNTPTTTITLSQGGDFLGGQNGSKSHIQLMRKAMNSFLCDVDREFQFVGRLNEDVTTYVLLGSRGELFFSMTNVCLIQTMHQSQKKGLGDTYKDWGEYIKAFYSVMYNPSSVKIREMGTRNKRIHHNVEWEHAVPKILNEKYKAKKAKSE